MSSDETRNHDLPFAKELFEAADRMRGSVESAEYKHLVLGLLFLKYISESWERRRAWLEAATRDPENGDYFTEDEAERAAILEDRDEYVSENVFWVPKEARFEKLLAAASQADIGTQIDDALDAIERDNPEQLRGVLPKVYAGAPPAGEARIARRHHREDRVRRRPGGSAGRARADVFQRTAMTPLRGVSAPPVECSTLLGCRERVSRR